MLFLFLNDAVEMLSVMNGDDLEVQFDGMC